MLRNNVLFEPDENSSPKDVGAKRARKSLSSTQEHTKVVAGSGEHGVDAVAVAALR